MEDVRKKIYELSKSIREELGQDTNKIQNDESLKYMIPYGSLPITSPKNENEVAISLENVIVAVKDRIYGGASVQVYELYTEEGTKIGATDEDGRMIYDKEIIDELIKDKIRIIREAGYEPAGVDSLNRVESVFDMIGRRIVTMNEAEKERLENSGDRRLCLAEITNEHDKKEIKEEEDPDFTPNLKDPDQNAAVMSQVGQDLGVEVAKITKVNAHDGAFWENNPEIRSSEVYAVLTKDNYLQLVTNENGKYKPIEQFYGSSNEVGRTTVILHDEDNLKDNTKNTYGAIYSRSNSKLRYTLVYGQYGEVHLVEQISHGNGAIEQSDKYLSREVATSNTDFMDQNLEGNESRDNITITTFRQSQGMTREASEYGSGSISDKIQKMKGDKEKDFKMQDLESDKDKKVADAMKAIKEGLNERNISLDPDEEDTILQAVTNAVKDSDEIICKEKIESVIEYVSAVKQNQQEEDKSQDNEVPNVQDKQEKQDERDDDADGEKTLANDALQRRLNGHH